MPLGAGLDDTGTAGDASAGEERAHNLDPVVLGDSDAQVFIKSWTVGEQKSWIRGTKRDRISHQASIPGAERSSVGGSIPVRLRHFVAPAAPPHPEPDLTRRPAAAGTPRVSIPVRLRQRAAGLRE
jgi:hypothetical protein